MKRSHAKWFSGDAVALSSSLALFFTFLERIKDGRSSLWCGLNWEESLGVLLVLSAYWVVLFVIASVLRKITARSRRESLCLVVSHLAAALILWEGLNAFQSQVFSMWNAAIVCFLVMLAGGALLLEHRGLFRIKALGVVLCWALVSGIVAHRASLEWFYLSPARANTATICAVLWTVVVSCAGGCAWRLVRRLPAAAAMLLIAGALAVLMPAAFWGIGATSLRYGWGQAKRDPEQRSLLFITCDALRASYCSSYGGQVPTSALESVAREGVLFRRSYSLAPWTLPSMNGMFLSAYPPGLTPGGSREQWVEELGDVLFDTSVPTLSERLTSKGYATGAFVGNPLLGDPAGILRGFQHKASFAPHAPVRAGLFARMPYFCDAIASCAPGLVPTRAVDVSRILSGFATTFLRQHASHPFFLWVHHIDPHDPYDPPQEFRTLGGPWPCFSPASPRWGTPQLDDYGNIDISDADRPYTRSLYEGEIQYVDQCIGELLSQLGKLDLGSETYVCVTSDHGEEFWEHGRYGHGQSLYDDLVHVPLAFKGPGIAHESVDTPVSAIDLMPTFVDLLGLPAVAEWRGKSLLPYLVGRQNEESGRPCFAQATNRYRWPQPVQMVVDGNHKLILEPGTGEAELYDVVADPEEKTNLVAAKPEEVQRLRALLGAWGTSVPTGFQIDSRTVSDDKQSELEEQLRGLGYID